MMIFENKTITAVKGGILLKNNLFQRFDSLYEIIFRNCKSSI